MSQKFTLVWIASARSSKDGGKNDISNSSRERLRDLSVFYSILAVLAVFVSGPLFVRIARALRGGFLSRRFDDAILVRAIRKQEARPAQFADIPATVDKDLVRSLHESGIHQFYTHQLQAFAIANSGRNVTIVTPTAPGKTLCYNLPVLNKILANPNARAVYMFPTKALPEISSASSKPSSTPPVPNQSLRLKF